MVMVTAKLSKQKLLLIAALLVAVVVVLCLCLHGSGNSSETPDTAPGTRGRRCEDQRGPRRLPRELWLGGRGGAGATQESASRPSRTRSSSGITSFRSRRATTSRSTAARRSAAMSTRSQTILRPTAAHITRPCSSTKTRSPGATSALPRRTASCTRSQCPPDRCGRICRGGRLCPPFPPK